MAQRKERDEQGAVAMIVAITTVLVLVPLTSLAIDIGYQRVAARDMQAVADVVAMDMARQLDGTSTTGLVSGGSWNAALANSLSRNDDQVVGEPLVPIACPAILTADLSPGKICAVPGIYDDGVFSRSGSLPATHVLVKTRTEVNYFFPIFADKGATAKEAIAEAPAGACFSVGSYVAQLNTDDSILAPLLNQLGTNLNLTVGDLNGLASADVSLLDLVDTRLGVGTVDELATATVGVGTFYLVMADALERESGQTAQVTLLRSLATKVGGLTMDVGDILAIDTGAGAGLDGRLNVLDLVSSSLFVADGNNFLNLPDTSIDIGSLVNLDSSVKVIQKPQIACGRKSRTSAASSQVDLHLGGDALSLDLGLLRIKFNIDIDIHVAPTEASLTGVTCQDPTKSIVLQTSSGLLSIAVKLDTAIELQTVLAGYQPLAKGVLTLSSSRSEDTSSVTVTIENGNYDLPASVGEGSLGAPNLHIDASTLQLLGLDLGPGIGGLTNTLLSEIVNPLVQGLDSALLSPLLESLGLQVAGAKIYALPEPKCGIPALRG